MFCESKNLIKEISSIERNVSRFSGVVSSDSTIMVTVCPSPLDV